MTHPFLPTLPLRQQRYYTLNHEFSLLSDEELQRQLEGAESSSGWGVNQTLTVAGQTVFVKRIPLTAREQTHSFDTGNLYQLPMYYHYGVGSAGFGAYRELITHLRTSNWVLQNQTAAFPLLFHYRIRPASATWRKVAPESRERHLKYWNQNVAIEKYLSERDQAPFEIQLFLEHIPYSWLDWFSRYPARNLNQLLHKADAALRFLNQQGILHLDAHLANLLTDGENVFISDFGLALDQRFKLAPDEQAFWQTHASYDRAQLVSNLNHLLLSHCDALPEDEQTALYQALAILPETERPTRLKRLLKTVSSPTDTQIPELPGELKQLLLKYHTSLLAFSDFFAALCKSDAKDIPWPACAFSAFN
ncbi:MAG: hypothetical protein IV090_05495 [Candidatus Sericytochromatia bacterium]|nr:hypothetical protein [Candidatus Sericytochromatia bacterium]